MAKKRLTKLQLNFIDEYLVDFSIVNAYIRAGYDVSNSKRSSIYQMAYRTFSNKAVQEELKARLEEIKQDKEVILQKLISKAIEIIESPDSKTSDVLKAMEYLGKLYSLGSENVNVNGTQDLTFNFQIESVGNTE